MSLYLIEQTKNKIKKFQDAEVFLRNRTHYLPEELYAFCIDELFRLEQELEKLINIEFQVTPVEFEEGSITPIEFCPIVFTEEEGTTIEIPVKFINQGEEQ